MYRKSPKLLHTQNIAIITGTLKLEQFGLHQNDEDRMANIADPDQTAPIGAVGSNRSSLVLVCSAFSGLSV